MLEHYPSHNQEKSTFLWLEDGTVADYKKNPIENDLEFSEFGYVDAIKRGITEMKAEEPDPEYLAALARGRKFFEGNRNSISNEPILSTGKLRFKEIADEYEIVNSDVDTDRKFVAAEVVAAYLEHVLKVYKYMDTAEEIEAASGIEAATEAYEIALKKLKELITYKPAGIPEPGYKFDLAVARCQSRLGVSEVTLPYPDSEYQHPNTEGRDRKADLREYALQSIGVALAKAGGKNAPLEDASLIMAQRSKIYSLYGKHENLYGNPEIAKLDLRESAKDLIAAEDLIHQSDELKIEPNLPQILEDQRRELEAAGVYF
jgi:hypothetical protein